MPKIPDERPMFTQAFYMLLRKYCSLAEEYHTVLEGFIIPQVKEQVAFGDVEMIDVLSDLERGMTRLQTDMERAMMALHAHELNELPTATEGR